jgi:propionyl-CoA synthetase
MDYKYVFLFQYEFAPLNKNIDLDYEFELSRAKPADCVPVAATDPVYILYTSGTTGTPKVTDLLEFIL